VAKIQLSAYMRIEKRRNLFLPRMNRHAIQPIFRQKLDAQKHLAKNTFRMQQLYNFPTCRAHFDLTMVFSSRSIAFLTYQNLDTHYKKIVLFR